MKGINWIHRGNDSEKVQVKLSENRSPQSKRLRWNFISFRHGQFHNFVQWMEGMKGDDQDKETFLPKMKFCGEGKFRWNFLTKLNFLHLCEFLDRC
jgi:hypothetical protein